MNRQEKTLITVSQTSVTEAEHAIEACENCSPDSKVPFVTVLQSFRMYDPDKVEYVLPILARCPSCSNEIDEITRVKPKHDISKLMPF